MLERAASFARGNCQDCAHGANAQARFQQPSRGPCHRRSHWRRICEKVPGRWFLVGCAVGLQFVSFISGLFFLKKKCFIASVRSYIRNMKHSKETAEKTADRRKMKAAMPASTDGGDVDDADANAGEQAAKLVTKRHVFTLKTARSHSFFLIFFLFVARPPRGSARPSRVRPQRVRRRPIPQHPQPPPQPRSRRLCS